MIYKPTFYKQYDKKWSSVSWDGTTIGNNGCGPTAIANVVSALRDLGHRSITPKETYKWICDNGYMTSRGMVHAGIPKALKHYGIEKVTETTKSSTVKKAIKANNWVVTLMSPNNRWSINGHFIVLYGVKNGKCLISDSGSSADSRQKDGPWSEFVQGAMKYWIVEDTADYDPGEAITGTNGYIEEEDENDINDYNEGSGVHVDSDYLKPNILMIDRTADPKDFKVKKWKENKVIGVMLEAGYYYDSNHKPVEVFRNPILYKQVLKIIRGKFEFGYFFRARAKNAKEVEKEMYELSFIVRKYPPTLGVWIRPEFINSTKKIEQNNLLFAQYEKELVRLGLTGKIGIRCKRSTLKKFNWKKYQKTWWLWLNDPVDKLAEIGGLLDPGFFDTDNKSGKLPEGAIPDSNLGRDSNLGDEYGGFDSTECSDIGDAAATWAEKIAKDDRFTYGANGHVIYHSSKHCGCWFCDHKHRWYCCNTFVWAAYVHGAHLAKACNSSGCSPRSWMSRKFKFIGNNPKASKMQRGDVILRNNPHNHVMLYCGNNKIVHAASSKASAKNSICIASLNRIRDRRGFSVYRYAGKKKLNTTKSEKNSKKK